MDGAGNISIFIADHLSRRIRRVDAVIGPSFELVVECTDASGNAGSASATAEFPEKAPKSKKKSQ